MRLLIRFVLIGFLLLPRAVEVLAAPDTLPLETREKLRAILDDPVLQDAHIGVEIIALGTASSATTFPAQPYADGRQPVLFERDATKRFMPASNVKLYTAALALRELGAEATLATVVRAGGDVVDSEVRGDLYLIGGGDPSLATADLEALAKVLRARGIRRIRGAIIGDGSAFEAESFGGRYPDGWTLDDALWYYGPEINALAVNRNQIDVTVTGAANGATLKFDPTYPQWPVENRVVRGADQALPKVHFDRAGDYGAITNRLVVVGSLALGQSVTEGVAVPAPTLWAATLLRQALQNNGIQVDGAARLGIWRGDAAGAPLATHASPPLKVLLQRFLKNSDNLYAEMLLRAAARHSGPGTAAHAHERLRDWLRQNGVETASLRFEDGSGLSRYNLVTPRATAQLLAAIEKLPGGAALYEALPVAAVDGTLRRRLSDTSAAGNVHAKTGSFSIASTLSGYVTTTDGQRLAVSVLTNFVRDTNEARRVQDAIFAALAEARWPES